jgi:hypothetical protein
MKDASILLSGLVVNNRVLPHAMALVWLLTLTGAYRASRGFHLSCPMPGYSIRVGYVYVPVCLVKGRVLPVMAHECPAVLPAILLPGVH